MAGPVPANHADPMVRRSIPWPAHACSSRSAGPAGVDGRRKAGQDGFQKPAWPFWRFVHLTSKPQPDAFRLELSHVIDYLW